MVDPSTEIERGKEFHRIMSTVPEVKDEMTEKEQIALFIEAANYTGEFEQLADDTTYWMPEGSQCGYLSAAMLRAMADELDNINAWKKEHWRYPQ